MSKPKIHPLDQDEWQAQERGMDAARGPVTGETRTGEATTAAVEYRMVAEALMSMPRGAPPMGFATSVARHAQHLDARFERMLSRILVGAFAAAMIVVGLCFGAQWWQTLRQSFDGRALQWAFASIGCVALSWVCRRLMDVAGNADGKGSIRPQA